MLLRVRAEFDYGVQSATQVLASIKGIVRIGCGRDAADIAFMTTSSNCECRKVAVSVEQTAP